ncbi:hypothetical protein ES695_11890 [Candidatus Atribacteria bacterium 1244-E10-H5-B2]|nr:MAG: hypothetical protein ES695_11890 [Candidatus Atribacteria bacterium 1244-E10-H5-B2]
MNDKEIKKVPKRVRNIKGYGKAILVFTILIFVSVLIFVSISLWQDGAARNTIQLLKYRDSYQVVFLTNGQAYFGNITEITNEYILLKDPYSIKVQQKQTDEEGQTKESEIKLLSIEDEFYKPKGYMLIEKSVINFIEELKDSSQIIDIIKNY